MSAAAGVMAAAFVGAVATAIITPDRINHLFRLPANASVTETTHSDVRYRTVTDRHGAISMSVPASWATLQGRFDVSFDGVQDKGVALNAGTDPQQGSLYGVDGVYVGASSATSTRLRMNDWSKSEVLAWATEQNEVSDFTLDSCVLTPRRVASPPGWITASRVWDNCLGKEGWSVFDIVGVSPDRRVVVVVDLRKSQAMPDAVLIKVAKSVAVQVEHLPDDAIAKLPGDHVLP